MNLRPCSLIENPDQICIIALADRLADSSEPDTPQPGRRKSAFRRDGQQRPARAH